MCVCVIENFHDYISTVTTYTYTIQCAAKISPKVDRHFLSNRLQKQLRHVQHVQSNRGHTKREPLQARQCLTAARHFLACIEWPFCNALRHLKVHLVQHDILWPGGTVYTVLGNLKFSTLQYIVVTLKSEFMVSCYALSSENLPEGTDFLPNMAQYRVVHVRITMFFSAELNNIVHLSICKYSLNMRHDYLVTDKNQYKLCCSLDNEIPFGPFM